MESVAILSNEIITKLGLDPDMRAHKLTQDDIARINRLVASGICR